MSIEAMKLALEALNSFPARHLTPFIVKARQDLRQALEQEEQAQPVELTEPQIERLLDVWFYNATESTTLRTLQTRMKVLVKEIQNELRKSQ